MSNLPSIFGRKSTTRPMSEMIRLQRQMDRLFDESWDTGFLNEPIATLQGPAFTPSCDVEDTETHYLMSFDLPGVKKDGIRIDLQEGVLTVSGERNEESESKSGKKYQSERFWGHFQRSFQVPAGTKPEQIEAHYADGVLRVAIPKVDAAKATSVKISEGKGGFWERLSGHKKEAAKPASSTQPSSNGTNTSVKIA